MARSWFDIAFVMGLRFNRRCVICDLILWAWRDYGLYYSRFGKMIVPSCSLREMGPRFEPTRLILILLLLCFASCTGLGDGENQDVQLLPKDEAATLLAAEDEFTISWSKFDVESRLQIVGGQKRELLDYCSAQARDWTDDEANKIIRIVEEIKARIENKNLKVSIPHKLRFVKTSGREEAGVFGYTRQDFIVLTEAGLNLPFDQLQALVAHELYHLLTKRDRRLRRQMFDLIGFELLSDVEYPESLAPRKITNPDTIDGHHRIVLAVDGRPVVATMILFASSEYAGGEMFDYLKLGFLELSDVSTHSPILVGDAPIIHEVTEVEGFFEIVGFNTNYFIHPEEILADNFSYMILDRPNLANPEIVEKMQVALQN